MLKPTFGLICLVFILCPIASHAQSSTAGGSRTMPNASEIHPYRHADLPTVSPNSGCQLAVATDAPTGIVRNCGQGWDLLSPLNVSSDQFGFIGDGRTDNSAAAYLANAYLKAHAGVTFTFTPGRYAFRDFPLTINVQSATIDFNGSEIINITDNSDQHNYGNNAMQTNTGLQFDLDPGDYKHVLKIVPYIPIESARAGDRKIVLKNAADLAAFTVRGWLQPGGWNQQEGDYPQNWRYFEYVRILSIDVVTRTLNLDRPLANSYNDQWFSGSYYSGSQVGVYALPLTRPLFTFTESLVLKNGTLLANPHCPDDTLPDGTKHNLTASLIINGAYHVVVENMQFSHLVISQTGSVELNNCHFITGEPDKQVNRVLIRDSSFIAIGQATGVDSVRIEHCTVGTKTVGGGSLSPRRLEVIGNEMLGASAISAGGLWPTTQVLVSDNRFETSTDHLYDATRPYSFTISAAVDANKFIVDQKTDISFISRIQIGGTLRTADGFKWFIVSDVTFDSANHNFIIHGRGNVPLKSGEVLQLYAILNFAARNNISTGAYIDNQMGKATGITIGENVTIEGGRDSAGVDLIIDGPFVNFRDVLVDGYVTSVLINVDKAYAGKNTAPRLIIRQNSLSEPDWLTVNLSQTGIRYIDLTGNHGFKSALPGEGVNPVLGATTNFAHLTALTLYGHLIGEFYGPDAPHFFIVIHVVRRK